MEVNKPVNLIGIHGHMGSGKDTVARVIQFLTQTHNEMPLDIMLNYPIDFVPYTTEWKIKKFAGKLKECVSLVTGLSLEDLEKPEVKNSYLPAEWDLVLENGEVKRFLVRELFQEFGTTGGRKIHPKFWINAMFLHYKPTLTDESKVVLNGYLSKPKEFKNKIVEYKTPKWLIPDVRRYNEMESIVERGGVVISVFRDKDIYLDNNTRTHISETELDGHKFDYIIDNNYDIETLVSNVELILRDLHIV